MKTPSSKVRVMLSRLSIFVLVLNVFLGLIPSLTPLQAQDKRVVVINADQPNVWTLEQAHYLLGQMHRRNLDLRAKKLQDLDPNEINGLRFDVLRQLIEAGVEFNQAERETNKLIAGSQNFDAERRQSLLSRRDELQDESLGLTRDITDLQSEKASATNQEDKDRLDAKIAAKTSRRAEVDKRIEQINEELKTLNAPTGSLKATEAEAQFDPNKLPKSVFDKAFEAAASKQIDQFNQAPQLNATLRLENFLQMQYEIIAKQLTLLRDEVGPGERLLFLELPQTVNVVHSEADKKWAQSWWRIVGYTRRPKSKETRDKTRDEATAQNKRATTQDNKATAQDDNDPGKRNYRSLSTSEKVEEILGLYSTASTTSIPNTTNVEFVDLETPRSFKTSSRTLAIDDQTVRTVELIPRQSSLNVNDMKLRVKSGAFSAVASFLFGFGARLNVQRQREQFSQFVQQELYSSAFGKGSREFGWTFTPMPGTDRLMSGVRTTYAVVVVPDNATSLVLESNGCYFPRSAYQPNDFSDTLTGRWNDQNRTSRNCGSSKAFLVPIPVGGSGRNDFSVDGVTYQPVDKGERIVVSVYGYNFSAQTGVLVNGSPLAQSIGLAQPLIRDDSETGARAAEDIKGEKVHGRIERVDSEQLVFSFEMPADFTGTPTITLVAPGKAIDINRLTDLYINGTRDSALTRPPNACPKDATVSTNGCELVCSHIATQPCITIADPMVNLDPEPKIKIAGLEVFRSTDGRKLTALASGKGFENTQNIFINGELVNPLPAGETQPFISSSLIRATIPTPPDETVQVVIATKDGTVKSKPVPNPAFLKISNVTVVSYEPPTRRSPVGVLIVKLEGSGFSGWLLPSTGNLTTLSSTEALLRIEDPASITPLILTDRRTGFEARTVITRKPPPK